jgi:hypothetical protein
MTTIHELQERFGRTRADVLAIIRTYRDIHGVESVEVEKEGSRIISIIPTPELLHELRRQR